MDFRHLNQVNLKQLVLARIEAVCRKQQDIQQHIANQAGIQLSQVDQRQQIISDRMNKQLAGIIAQRLLEDDPLKPLFSTEDIVENLPGIFRGIPGLGFNELDSEERQEVEYFATTQLKQALDILITSGRTPREEYKNWLRVVIGLAQEHNLTPLEVARSDYLEDEIVRRVYTKKEFLAVTKEFFDRHLNNVRNLLLGSILERIPVNEIELRQEAEQDFDREVMPLILAHFRRVEPIAIAWLQKEIKRIYD